MFFYLFCLPFLTEANIIDILEKQDSSFNLKKQIKQDISTVFVNKPVAFIQAFESKDFEKALEIWLNSIQQTAFAKSSTGSALYSYLLFKNHFEALALNYLLKNTQPSQINPVVSRLWKLDIDKTKLIWKRFYFPISPEWQNVFSPEIVFQIGSKSPMNLIKDQNYMKSLLSLPLDEKIDVFPLEWLFVLSLIQKQDMDSATKVLSWLLSKTKDSYRKDKINLTIARLLADIGESKASEHYYKKIKRISYLWFLAQEELVWLNLRDKNSGRAYSTAMALNHPGFLQSISSSMCFVMALSQLKNCDDEGATQNLINFKQAFLNQSIGLQKILDQKLYKNLIPILLAFYDTKNDYYKINSPLVDLFSQDLTFLQNKKKKGEDNKQTLAKMKLFYNLKTDRRLKNDILLYNHIENNQQPETTKFRKLSALKDKVVLSLEDKIQARIELLLKTELKNIQSALNSFHLIEAEILYRKYGALSGLALWQGGASWFKDFSLYKSKSLIYFPFNKDEIWLDELSSYKASKSSKCPEGNYIL